MEQRGRKSAASLAIITSEGVEPVRRPEPPDDLTDEQTEEWRKIVNSLSAEWFRPETHAMLAQRCRHVEASRRIAQLIAQCEAAEELDLKEYDKLLAMQERESRCLASLDTRLRLTPQSRYDAKHKKPTATKKPWE